jgi:hypothetical protein
MGAIALLAGTGMTGMVSALIDHLQLRGRQPLLQSGF